MPRVNRTTGASNAGPVQGKDRVAGRDLEIVRGDLVVAGDLAVTGDPDGGGRPLIFWQHPRSQAVPNNLWTPLAWNLRRNNIRRTDWSSVPAPVPTTTIAAAEEGLTLPKAQIRVASTADFTSSGYIAIEDPPGAGIDTVVAYTGKQADRFTGAAVEGFGTGTLSEGQTVRQAVVELTLPSVGSNGALAALVAEAAFEASATGSRGIRVMFVTPGVGLLAGAQGRAAAAPDGATHVQTAEQPGRGPGATDSVRIEAFQNSGGVLDVVVDGLASPRLVVTVLHSYDGTVLNWSD